MAFVHEGIKKENYQVKCSDEGKYRQTKDFGGITAIADCERKY